MLSLNEIKIGKIIKVSDEPYLVIKADHHKMGRGGAILKTKLKNLISGHFLDKTFQGNEKAEEAETQIKTANFIYQDKLQAYFMDDESYEQFSLPLEQIGEKLRFLKEGAGLDVFYFQGQPVAIQLPIKVALKVISAPPGVKGNSAGNVTKVVRLETGAEINAPMFINQGDLIKVNTETGEYAERV